MNFVLGAFVGALVGVSLCFIAPHGQDNMPTCTKESGDSFWTRKKELVPCPTK